MSNLVPNVLSLASRKNPGRGWSQNKQNKIKHRVMLSGEGNENGEKTDIGLISKKATLHVQHTFFVHFFAVVLHDCNVKRPETS